MGPYAWIATALIGAVVGGVLVGFGIGIGRELGRREVEVMYDSEAD